MRTIPCGEGMFQILTLFPKFLGPFGDVVDLVGTREFACEDAP